MPIHHDYAAHIDPINPTALQAANRIPVQLMVECEYPDGEPPGIMILLGSALLGYLSDPDPRLAHRIWAAPDQALTGSLTGTSGAWTVRVAGAKDAP